MAIRPKAKKNAMLKGNEGNVRSVSCGETMHQVHTMQHDDTMAQLLDAMTKNDWDHVFIIDDEHVPLGRVHAVDLLKLISRKSVNRNIAWMHAVLAKDLIQHPSLTVKTDTPLLKAGALMLTHDLNQLGVVNQFGELVGVVGHQTLARVIPRFVLNNNRN